MLQPIAKAQQTYFKDSFVIKQMLDRLKVPANASLFKYNAISMYTNTDIENYISRLSEYLLKLDT